MPVAFNQNTNQYEFEDVGVHDLPQQDFDFGEFIFDEADTFEELEFEQEAISRQPVSERQPFAPRAQRFADIAGFEGEKRTDSVLTNAGMDLKEMFDGYKTLFSMLGDNPWETIKTVSNEFLPALKRSYTRWHEAWKQDKLIEAVEKHPIQFIQDMTLPISLAFGGVGGVAKLASTGSRLGTAAFQVARAADIVGLATDPFAAGVTIVGKAGIGAAARRLKPKTTELDVGTPSAALDDIIKKDSLRNLSDQSVKDKFQLDELKDDWTLEMTQEPRFDNEIANFISKKTGADPELVKARFAEEGPFNRQNAALELAELKSSAAFKQAQAPSTRKYKGKYQGMQDVFIVDPDLLPQRRKFNGNISYHVFNNEKSLLKLKKWMNDNWNDPDMRPVIRSHNETTLNAQGILDAYEGGTTYKGVAITADKARDEAVILAQASITQELLDNVYADAAKAAAPGSSQIDEVKFLRSTDWYKSASDDFFAGRTQAGRSLNIYNKIGKDFRQEALFVNRLIENAGGSVNVKKYAEMVYQAKGKDGGAAVAKTQSRAATALDAMFEVHEAGMLWGPQTAVVNLIGTGLSTFATQVVEPALAFAMSKTKLFSLSDMSWSEVTSRVGGLMDGFKQARRMGPRLFAEEAPGELSMILPQFEGSDALQPGKFKKVATLPFRVLEGTDRIFYLANFNSSLYGLVARKLRKSLGITNLDNKTLRDAVEVVKTTKYHGTGEGVLLSKKLFKGKGGELVDSAEDIMTASQDQALDATFKTGLHKTRITDPDLKMRSAPVSNMIRDIGHFVKQGKNRKTPMGYMMRLLAPFVVTPTNLMDKAVKMTPLAFAMPDVREALKLGGIPRNAAVARMGLGTILASGATLAWMNDMITGGSPSDPQALREWRAQNKQEYSVKIPGTETFINYGRLDPYGTTIGFVADILNASDVFTDGEYSDATSLVFASIAKSVKSKLFLRGMTEAMKAFDDPDRNMERWLGNVATSFVPFSSLIAQTERTLDPELREATSMLEMAQAKTPGASEYLAHRVNLWGEPIKFEGPGFTNSVAEAAARTFNPFYMRTRTKDKVTDTLIRLNSFPGMPKKTIVGVRLTPHQYEEYATEAGRTAKIILDQYAKTPDWNNAMKTFAGREQIKQTVEKVIKETRRRARENLMIKYTGIKEQARELHFQEILKIKQAAGVQ